MFCRFELRRSEDDLHPLLLRDEDRAHVLHRNQRCLHIWVSRGAGCRTPLTTTPRRLRPSAVEPVLPSEEEEVCYSFK